ncbi:MAG: excinuclease ABC subunit UvrB [Christensenellales bacterium]|jgi:excinuclease ABC subunit B
MSLFQLHAPYEPTGDQPKAIQQLTQGIQAGLQEQVLLGVTGSGKTFTIANVIANTDRPALVIAHNKTLAAQLCSELKDFFPENAVEYFVSYYDYYQPEAYIPSSDTYIEKDSAMNEEIDKLRHSATSALMERRDVIVVASVSCIYGLGSPETYRDLTASLRTGMTLERDAFIRKLVDIQYDRNDLNFIRGTFRVRGDVVEVFPASQDEKALRIQFFGDEVERIIEFNATTGRAVSTLKYVMIFPATHHATTRERLNKALNEIEIDMEAQIKAFEEENKLIEAQRIRQRTQYDLEMLREIGYCNGMENYSRYFDGRKQGEPSYTLLDFFPEDYLLFIDESHVTVGQIRAMHAGDFSRKDMLVKYGFRLPAAYDNRPLRFDEFEERMGQTVYMSATPADFEMQRAGQVVEQVVRPTGLVDPEVFLRPVEGQVDDLIQELRKVVAKGQRALVTTLTKKMAEGLTDYLKELDFKVTYLHSDVETLDRVQILRDLRMGVYDVLVGINLLREGLDLPEVALVAILDADKEGFLRSGRSLIQTIGRAARNVDGYVVMYGDMVTDSMKLAVSETNRRRELQMAYNLAHGITPQSVASRIRETLAITQELPQEAEEERPAVPHGMEKMSVQELEKAMLTAAADLDFEKAARLRDMWILKKKERKNA